MQPSCWGRWRQRMLKLAVEAGRLPAVPREPGLEQAWQAGP